MMTAQRSPCPNLGNCEYVTLRGKRDLTVVTEIMILGDLMFWVGPMSSQGSF